MPKEWAYKRRAAIGRGKIGVGILLVSLGFSFPASAQRVFDLSCQLPDVVFQTPAPGSDLGYSFAVGDLNADGNTDLVIGAPGLNADLTPQDGAVYLFWGGRRFPAVIDFITSTPDVEIVGHPSASGAGTTLFCRDINGDHVDDLIIGAPYADHGNYLDVGMVEIIFGHNHFPSRIDLQTQSPDVLIWGEADSDKFGRAITAGDANGDGIADLLIASPGASTINGVSSGVVYVMLGRLQWNAVIDLGLGLLETNRLLGKAPNNFTATSLAMGNFNGDPFADFLIGAHKANFDQRVDCGETYLILGSEDLLATIDLNDADLLIAGAQVRDFSGWAVGAIDINNDGQDEMVTSSPGATNGSLAAAGRTHFFDFTKVLSDTIDLVDSAYQLSVLGPHRNSRLAHYVLGADVNNDAISDILLGIPADSSVSGLENAGAIAVVYGRGDLAGDVNLQVTPPDLAIIGGEAGSLIGNAFTAADFDGDGKIDIALKKSFGVMSNTAYLIYGSSLISSVAFRQPSLAGPEQFTLKANYPNPFHHETHLVIDAVVPLMLEVAIYDLTGRRIRTLFASDFPSGQKILSWDGLSDTGERLAAGIYFVRASATIAGRRIVRTIKLTSIPVFE